MSEAKETLRQEARRHRARMDPNAEDADTVASHFMDALKPQAGQVIAAYWPQGREFDTRPLLGDLLKQGFTCALPVVQTDHLELKFAVWTDGEPLVKSQFKTLQPEISKDTKWLEPDIVIVPLLAFDRRGYRLGQGGGYYDATLKLLRNKKPIQAVGIAYAQQACLFNLPVEDHDEKLDWVITPAGAQAF